MAENELEFQPNEEDIKHLREWISKSPHILQDYDDKILSAFVRGCKGSLQKTKKVLEGFNSLGQRYPNIMKNYDPLDQRLVDFLSGSVMFTLPNKAPDGSIVFMALVRHYEGFKGDPYKMNNADFFRYWLLSLNIFLWKNNFGPGKWTIVADCKHSTLAHNVHFTPVLVKQGLEIMQNALPIRLQGVHIVNVPPFLESIFNFAKSLAKKKISERIFLHSTMDTLYEKLPKEILPKEYGGNEESTFVLHDQWYETVKSFRKKFLEEESEMRRLDPLRPKADEEEEMVGTFKSLTVD